MPLLDLVFRRLQSDDLTPEKLKEIVSEVNEYVGENRGRQRQLGSIVTRQTRAADFETKGTAAARKQIEAWAKKYGRKK